MTEHLMLCLDVTALNILLAAISKCSIDLAVHENMKILTD